MDPAIIEAAKQYDKERSKKYYEENKKRIREKYQAIPPEKKHERSEQSRKKRYELKHGNLEGYVPRVFGEPRQYKSGYYLEHKDKIKQQYQNLTEEQKLLRKARVKSRQQSKVHGHASGVQSE